LPSGSIDALFMVSALPVPHARFEPICAENVVAMVSRHSPLARRRTISVSDLRGKTIIASRLEENRFQHSYLRQLLGPFDIEPRILEAPSSCAVQLAYAGAGKGILLATASMMKCSFPDVVAVPFAERLPQVQLGIMALESNHSTALKIFRQVAAECVTASHHLDQDANSYVSSAVALRA
jgi:LysR substrate binding domain